MRDHTKLRAFELADEVAVLIYRALGCTTTVSGLRVTGAATEHSLESGLQVGLL